MATTTVKCFGCGVEYDKDNGELKRRLAKGRPLYCSSKCAADSGLKYNLGVDLGRGNSSYLKGYEKNRLDDLSPFRFFLNRAWYRSKKKGYESDLDVEYLRDVWNQQNGICPLSGVQLELPEGTRGWNDIADKPNRASMDRIDPTKGYLKENVRFISLIANYAKSTWTDAEVVDFCQSVVGFHK
jgi:hypothetical protein